MEFYPEGLAVPEEWRTQDLWLRVLRPDVTELDYAALMESRERLRRWSESSWPADDFTLDENHKDLVQHEREWEERVAFAYTVLNADGTRCEGCVYIYPLGRWLEHSAYEQPGAGQQFASETPAVTFWVRDSALERGLDRQLLAGLRMWFQTEWPYQMTVFLVTSAMPEDIALLEASRLARHTSYPSRSSTGVCYAYGEPLS